MKRFISILFALTCLACLLCCATPKEEYPATPSGVAEQFFKLYYSGDIKVADYIKFDGAFLSELAMTAESARKEVLPAELKKAKMSGDIKVKILSERREFDDLYFNTDVAYVTGKINDKEEVVTIYKEKNGQWKVDITDKWANDWFDGMMY